MLSSCYACLAGTTYSCGGWLPGIFFPLDRHRVHETQSDVWMLVLTRKAGSGQRLRFTDLLMDPDMDGFADKLWSRRNGLAKHALASEVARESDVMSYVE